MKSEIVYPAAKINIGLRLINRQEDGFHAIESIFYKVPIYDILEIRALNSQGQMVLTNSGLDIPGRPEDNLLFTCYRLMQTMINNLISVEVHLHKVIPIGAGLGGGSSDVAYFAQTLNKIMGNPLNQKELKKILDQLGSDCSFFLNEKPQFVFGIGEIQEEALIDLSGRWLVLIYPNVHVSTSEAYGSCQPTGIHLDLKVLENEDLWQSTLINDFESSVFKKHLEISKLKSFLQDSGAYYASMSGSGSSIYGIFKEKPDIDNKKGFWQRVVEL